MVVIPVNVYKLYILYIYTTTHDTLSTTAFVAQSAERRTRFAGS